MRRLHGDREGNAHQACFCVMKYAGGGNTICTRLLFLRKGQAKWRVPAFCMALLLEILSKQFRGIEAALLVRFQRQTKNIKSIETISVFLTASETSTQHFILFLFIVRVHHKERLCAHKFTYVTFIRKVVLAYMRLRGFLRKRVRTLMQVLNLAVVSLVADPSVKTPVPFFCFSRVRRLRGICGVLRWTYLQNERQQDTRRARALPCSGRRAAGV